MDEDGPGWGHLCHTDTVLVFPSKISQDLLELGFQNLVLTLDMTNCIV